MDSTSLPFPQDNIEGLCSLPNELQDAVFDFVGPDQFLFVATVVDRSFRNSYDQLIKRQGQRDTRVAVIGQYLSHTPNQYFSTGETSLAEATMTIDRVAIVLDKKDDASSF